MQLVQYGRNEMQPMLPNTHHAEFIERAMRALQLLFKWLHQVLYGHLKERSLVHADAEVVTLTRLQIQFKKH